MEITGVASLESAETGDIAFLTNRRYQRFLASTKASALLLPDGDWDFEIPYIICENPYYAFATLMQQFHRIVQDQVRGVQHSAIIADDVRLGLDISIGANVIIDAGGEIGNRSTVFPNCYIGRGSRIGEDVTIYPNVTIREGILIGDRVIIHSGSVIGSDGFGYAEDNGKMLKIPQKGGVVIEDDVEIGANCCIDRGTLGETRIHKGAKLDNLIQIAHNVIIGEDTVIAAQCGVSGSSQIGNHAKLAGQVGLAGHITLGDYTICGAQSGITKSHDENTVLSGMPARPHREQLKIEAAQSKLPELLLKFTQLQRRIEDMEKMINSKQID